MPIDRAVFEFFSNTTIERQTMPLKCLLNLAHYDSSCAQIHTRLLFKRYPPANVTLGRWADDCLVGY